MGRKGVSKRKQPKPKAPTASSPSANNTVSSVIRESESVAARDPGKDKGRKKK